MTTYFARKEYTYSSGDAIFSIPFSYIKKEHISVYINDEETENYTYLNNSQIQVSDTLEAGDIVSIVRSTPITSKMVEFSDTSILNKDTQNLAQDQVFDAVQEIYDDNLVFQADIDEQFTDYKSTVDNALNTIDGKADLAISTANGAVNTANSANSKADNAVSTANSANSKADNAVSTANTASSNASTAVNTANTAKNTADTAKETADNTKSRVDEFEDDIEAVIEAAEKINELEEAVQTAVGAAGTATDKAEIAADKADDAIAAANRAEAVVPSQTGHNGKFLQTNGTTTSWENVDALPSQTGKNGKFLKTDGTDASWEDIPIDQTFGGTSTNAQSGVSINNELNTNYQSKLVSGTNIKTINGQSILGSGNLQTPYRNVGEIVASSLPLTDAGLHLLDGSLILGGGIYQGFVDYIADLYSQNTLFAWLYNDGIDDYIIYTKTQTIASDTVLYNADGTSYSGADFTIEASGDDYVIQYSGNNTTYTQSEDITANYFTTEALWQQSVTTYGVCGKFVYNSVNNTVRLPKITGILEGTTDATALGDLVEAGLPNITGIIFNPVNTSGAFKTTTTPMSGSYYNNEGSIGAKIHQYQVTFSASETNSIYGNSSTVQPQTIKAFYYIVIANSTKTEIQSDIDEIATDLNGKADVDLTNATNVANIKMAHNAMPSNTYTNLTVGASGSTYTAPADGYICVRHTTTGSYGQAYIVCGKRAVVSVSFDTSWISVPVAPFPVKKGDVFQVIYVRSTINEFCFVYAIGSESEAS